MAYMIATIKSTLSNVTPPLYLHLNIHHIYNKTLSKHVYGELASTSFKNNVLSINIKELFMKENYGMNEKNMYSRSTITFFNITTHLTAVRYLLHDDVIGRLTSNKTTMFDHTHQL